MKNIVKLESGREMMLTSMSSREIVLKHHSLSSIEVTKNEKNEIININVDGYDTSIGDILHVKIFDHDIKPFKILYIDQTKELQYSLFATRITKAARWIMPMLRNKNQTYTSMKYGTHLVNCYVGTKEEGYMPCIYLVYRFSGSMEYRNFEESLKQHELFEKMTDLDKYHVMYIFNMTSDQQQIFKKFQKGKYSKFPDNYKKKVISFVVNPVDSPTEADRKTTITYGALYRTDLQRAKIESLISPTPLPKDAEYFSIPTEEEEVYTGDIEIHEKIRINEKLEKE